VREAFSNSGFWSDVVQYGCTWALLYAAPTRFLLRDPAADGDGDNPLRGVLMCPLLREVDDRVRFAVPRYVRVVAELPRTPRAPVG
jgi:hypothetical protein